MKITSKHKSAILDFFKTNLVTKDIASGIPSQLAALRCATDNENAEELWELWTRLIAQRAEYLHLNEYLVMILWGTPIFSRPGKKNILPADI
ncbi:MAG: hypothetical protein PHQ75_05175, partial [Thermoguttaceae bacterium]|nr:hypothetical protein [Thermoguttaceae bacterium]